MSVFVKIKIEMKNDSSIKFSLVGIDFALLGARVYRQSAFSYKTNHISPIFNKRPIFVNPRLWPCYRLPKNCVYLKC